MIERHDGTIILRFLEHISGAVIPLRVANSTPGNTTEIGAQPWIETY